MVKGVIVQKLSQNMIKFLFKDKYIPTLDNDLKINDEYAPRWQPNFLDLSPLEIIWSIIKQMFVFFPPKDMDDLKKTIKKILDSIPKSICENIIEHMKYRWELCIKYKGRRLKRNYFIKFQKLINK